MKYKLGSVLLILASGGEVVLNNSSFQYFCDWCDSLTLLRTLAQAENTKTSHDSSLRFYISGTGLVNMKQD